MNHCANSKRHVVELSQVLLRRNSKITAGDWEGSLDSSCSAMSCKYFFFQKSLEPLVVCLILNPLIREPLMLSPTLPQR